VYKKRREIGDVYIHYCDATLQSFSTLVRPEMSDMTPL